MSFHERCMRNASAILFWIAVVIFVVGLASTLLAGGGAVDLNNDRPVELLFVLSAVFQALSAAVWPFTGAALIWWLRNRPAGAAE